MQVTPAIFNHMTNDADAIKQKIAQIPVTEILINLIKTDGKNPNRMSDELYQGFLQHIKDNGILNPIIVTEDFLLADGEHRVRAAKDLGMISIKARIIPNDERLRRLLRQTMNKIHGKHDEALDAEEFKALIDMDGIVELAGYLGEDSGDMLKILDKAISPKEDDPDDYDLEATLAAAPEKPITKPGDVIRMVNALRKEALADLLPELPEDGEYIHIISNGDYDYYGFIPLFTERLGHIDELYGSTWTMNRGNVENLLALFDAGKIDRISIITGLFFKRRETAVYATLIEGLAERGQKYVSCENHAKVLLMRSDDKYFVVEGSANWTANPRIEQNPVARSRTLWEHHRSWMGEYLEM